jgi:hypothetical protein
MKGDQRMKRSPRLFSTADGCQNKMKEMNELKELTELKGLNLAKLRQRQKKWKRFRIRPTAVYRV